MSGSHNPDSIEKIPSIMRLMVSCTMCPNASEYRHSNQIAWRQCRRQTRGLDSSPPCLAADIVVLCRLQVRYLYLCMSHTLQSNLFRQSLVEFPLPCTGARHLHVLLCERRALPTVGGAQKLSEFVPNAAFGTAHVSEHKRILSVRTVTATPLRRASYPSLVCNCKHSRASGLRPAWS